MKKPKTPKKPNLPKPPNKPKMTVIKKVLKISDKPKGKGDCK